MFYFIAPIIAWLVSGGIKFLINLIRFGRDAFNKIGNGGFPSTHTTIVATPTAWIGFHEGIKSSTFGLGIAIIIIVVIDATGLRRHVGKHAKYLNLTLSLKDQVKFRESMGHSKFEVFGGLLLGAILGFLLNILSDLV